MRSVVHDRDGAVGCRGEEVRKDKKDEIEERDERERRLGGSGRDACSPWHLQTVGVPSSAVGCGGVGRWRCSSGERRKENLVPSAAH